MLACVTALQAGAAEPAAADAPADDRTVAYREFRAAFDAADYERALPLAIKVVELTGAQFGGEAPELANPFTNLATTLYRMQRHGDAVDAYRRALTILDLLGNATDPRLIAPLHGMGATLRALDRNEEAILPLKRAVDIIRNRSGLHAPAQLPALTALIGAYEATGRSEDAGREHQYAYNVAEQAWGQDDPRMVDAAVQLAGWYERTGRYTTARLLYTRAAQLADSKQPNGLLAVEALRGVARCYRLSFVNGESQEAVAAAPGELPGALGQSSLAQMVAMPSTMGERALRDALQRLEAAAQDRPAERAAVLIDLGDWYRIAGAGDRALSSWQQAWYALEKAGDTAVLAEPVMIVYRPPSVAASGRQQDPDEYDVQEVELQVSIAADGRLQDATVANPAPEREAAERAVLQAVRRATWRPAYAGGVPVLVTDFLYREKVNIRLPREEPAG